MTRYILTAAATLYMVGTSGFADASFEPYQVILDRNPFGEAPSAEDSAPVPDFIPIDQTFAKTLKMTAIIDEDDGTRRVGLIDTSNNDSYFLAEGDISLTGIECLSVDYDGETALLQMEEQVVEIKLQTGEFTALTPAQKEERMARKGPSGLSYAERRAAREARRRELAARPPPQPVVSGDDLQGHLQEYQMEVLRQGLPPLPIPLTPEMDDQLVAEGVLPPVE
jgi:hypothetical protein